MIATMFDDEIRIGLSTGLEAYRETAPAGNEVLIIRPERRQRARGGVYVDGR